MPQRMTDDVIRKRKAVLRATLLMRLAVYESSDEIGITPDESWAWRAVWLGHMEGRPLDVSDAAALTRTPVPSMSRYLRHVEEKGLVASKKEGRRVVYRIPKGTEHAAITKLFKRLEDILGKEANEVVPASP